MLYDAGYHPSRTILTAILTRFAFPFSFNWIHHYIPCRPGLFKLLIGNKTRGCQRVALTISLVPSLKMYAILGPLILPCGT
ncbi:hypothetical protein BDV27DRAFT_128957 [Aspergillus caelatus]|uniref:Uncharacterized protein n=1 Tax=Aspergillus caelatus TaxID=61420 RepID=A0A5N7A400_9EURO|nr:uncharacterized protein BDV27DRAFT_128957 [Aspergillus caelatus]KAE8364168.1 hypothetical protein BDV27DRAFT_128957 [Aspergillus caelatus]